MNWDHELETADHKVKLLLSILVPIFLLPKLSHRNCVWIRFPILWRSRWPFVGISCPCNCRCCAPNNCPHYQQFRYESLVKIIAEKAKYAALRVIRIHSTSWPRSIHLNGLPSFGASSFGHIKRRLPRIHLHGIQASESKLQAAESKPAPASSNLHASFVTSIPRNPSIKVWSHQSSMPVRRIHLNGIQASNFGHINPPRQSVASTSKKSKLRISATSTLHPRPIGGVRCARRAITFVLYTFVANNCREWEHARAPTERAHWLSARTDCSILLQMRL